MSSKQTATGVKVFGSAVLLVEPDVASLTFSVVSQAAKPKAAFQETHQAAQRNRTYLDKANIHEVAGSHVHLAQAFEYVEGRNRPAGYQARVSFNVLVPDLNRLEDVLVGVVDAGADQISSVEFRTSHLKEHRAEARRRAVASAREKAENYCRAAGVALGPVVSLEDVHPGSLRGSGEGNTASEVPADEGGPVRALSPASIWVGAAVSITFAIEGPAGGDCGP